MDRRSMLLALGATLLAGRTEAQELPFLGDLFGDDTALFRQRDLMGGSFAIATSELALQRSRRASVRRFAHWEIDEQTKVAEALGAAPGGAPLRPDQAGLYQQLQASDAATFDAHYVTGQLLGHRELFALNEDYLHAHADGGVRNVADMSIPIIRRHLAILHRLHRSIA